MFSNLITIFNSRENNIICSVFQTEQRSAFSLLFLTCCWWEMSTSSVVSSVVSAVIDLTDDNFSETLQSKGSFSFIDLTLPDSQTSSQQRQGINRRKRKERMGSSFSSESNLSGKYSLKCPTFHDELVKLRDFMNTLTSNISSSSSSLSSSPRPKAKNKTR